MSRDTAAADVITVASYERVSTRLQGLLGALAKDTTQYAAEQGWHLPEELRFRGGEDRNASGADWDLPGLNAMLDAAKRHEFTVLVVPAVDRFARNMAKALVLEEQLRKYGVRVVYLASPVDDTPEGRRQVHVQHMFAEYDRDKRRFQSMRGRREKIERGHVRGQWSCAIRLSVHPRGSSQPRRRPGPGSRDCANRRAYFP